MQTNTARRRLHQLLVGCLTAVLIGTAMTATAAQAAPRPTLGMTSLQDAIASDGNQFDTLWGDFDIATEVTRTVLDAKPGSALSAVKKGNVALTAFIPTDRAFRKFVKDLSGTRPATEQDAYAALVAHASTDQLEQLMLSQIVPNARLTVRKLRRSNGAVLTTMSGSKIKVRVWRHRAPRIVIADSDRTDQNAWLLFFKRNLNKGNLQIAQGVDRVIRPVDL
ncbi:MAG TPA: fasciclin domain-containing protein [Marmoricola sp.]|jgi:hypothetical protein|nr:fasciclin domain-containing protein [Nocardioidaceae bacterium]MCO5325349.1 fasciclin domain-containing protein [Nocardioidaceae bacterium]HRV69897.1 fasciclin domain-containing protein [Marmoricola sp.]